MADYRRRAELKNLNPMVAEALDDLASRITNTGEQVAASPDGLVAPPPSVSSLAVSAAQGIFDISINDNNSSIVRGINYFLEYSLSPSFTAPHVKDLGSSRNWRGFLGNQTLYWRAYSSYPTSARSKPVYYGTELQPTATIGGGTATGPAPLGSNGSGTSKGSSGSDGGFGNNPYRGDTRPPIS